MDRRRREKVSWEMITEHSSNPFTDLKCKSRSKLLITNSVGRYPNTALFNPIFFSCQGSDLSSLGRLIMKKEGLMVVVNDGGVPLF